MWLDVLICAFEQRVESISPKPQSYYTKEEDGYLEGNPSTIKKENGGKLILVRQPVNTWLDLDNISFQSIPTLTSDSAFYYGNLPEKVVLTVPHH